MTGLVGRYPTNYLIGRSPILRRRIFRGYSIPASIHYGALTPVSREYSPP